MPGGECSSVLASSYPPTGPSYDKALGAGADAVIVELEGAVAPTAKGAAREALANWLDAAAARPVILRINLPRTD